MHSYFNYGVLFLAAVVHTAHVPYGYSTPRTNGYHYLPVNRLWNNRLNIPNYDVHTNEILSNNNQGTDEKVRLQVYYESLCPDCIRDSRYLVHTALKLAPYLNIQIYPYGNAKTYDDGNGNVTFTCQHGPKECYGNKLHACAIDSITNITTAITFNGCMMNARSDDRAADKCGNDYGVDSATIKACAKGQKGTQLLKYYGEESKKIGFNYVPYVLINGVESGEDNLMKNVCQAFKNPPPECQGYLWTF